MKGILTLLKVYQSIVYDLSDLLDILLHIVLDRGEELCLSGIDQVIDVYRLIV